MQNFSFCAVQATSVIWMKVAISLQIAFGATMCMLALVQFVRQSLQMYRATKQWELDRYMNLLAKDGILYFFVYVPVSSFPLPQYPFKLAQSIDNRANGLCVAASCCIAPSTYYLPLERFQQKDGRCHCCTC